jgi:hypothetical protein
MKENRRIVIKRLTLATQKYYCVARIKIKHQRSLGRSPEAAALIEAARRHGR